MPSSGSSQVFAFTALSPSRQLNLAARMSSSALIDFASESPAFRNFLLFRTEAIVTEALRVQYGFIPDTADWGGYGPLPLPARGRNLKLNWMSELPALQRLRDEELGGESVRRLLQFIDGAEQDYGVGARGLIKCALKYNSLRNGGDWLGASREIGYWLRSFYTEWGIVEMVEVYDKLKEAIEEAFGLQRLEKRVKSLLIDRLLCGMDILNIWSAGGGNRFEDLVRLGIIEMIKPRQAWGLIGREPSQFGNWRVCDEECAGWFIKPAEYALSCINEPFDDLSFSVSSGSINEFDGECWEDEFDLLDCPPRMLAPEMSAKGRVERSQPPQSPPAHAPQTTAITDAGRIHARLRDPWDVRSPIHELWIEDVTSY
ncbi:hypothetical protein HOY80DRAFT_1133483 [Tuber brumale]|nr:hypothetical protein HOY80DRAFT_1133483 [Tuber brumale]